MSAKHLMAESSSQTVVNVTKLRHIWTINTPAFLLHGMGEKLESSTFSADANDKLKWCLHLYPHGIQEEHKEFMSLFLVPLTTQKAEYFVSVKFSIMNDANVKHQKKTNKKILFREHIGFADFVRNKFVVNRDNGLMVGNKLVICCDVHLFGKSVNIPGSSERAVQCIGQEAKLLNDLEQLMENATFSDVTLVVGDNNFRVHKNMLAQRSEVFAAMFKHEMKERQDNYVLITDIRQEVLKELLRFIYTSKSPNLNQMAFDLLAAADKYAIVDLKMMCAKVLSANLTVDGAADTLVLADRHSAQHLKSETINFIKNHAAEFMKTNGWQNLKTSHAYLIDELIHELLTLKLSLSPSQQEQVEPTPKRLKLN